MSRVPDSSNYFGLVGAPVVPLRRHGREKSDGPIVLASERQFEQNTSVVGNQSLNDKMWDTVDITETDPSAADKYSPVILLPVKILKSR
ncbi:MAG: hypothetical protein WC310_02205 [Patescibacteria group bacterium]|jgi:hypothetical protein